MSKPLASEEDMLAERYRWMFEASPGEEHNSAAINMMQLQTPLGVMVAGVTAKGVCLLEFMNRINLEKELRELQETLNAVLVPKRTPLSAQLEAEVTEYFEGTRKTFFVPLHTPGNAFSQSVWQHLRGIPYGTTCAYKQQAASMGNPKAIRAIASANGRNRLAIIIPCHRVIGSNGTMTGYAAGVAKKKWLLNFERSNSAIAPGFLL